MANGDGLTFPALQLKRVIEASLDAMIADPKALDWMLSGLTEDDRQSMRTALRNREGKVRVGFPQEVPEDWQISVILVGTRKEPATIGNIVSPAFDDVIVARVLGGDIDASAEAVLTGVSTAGLEPRGTVLIEGERAIYRLDGGTVVLEVRGILETSPAAHDAGTQVLFYKLAQRIGWGEVVTVRADVFGSNAEHIDMLSRMLEAYLVLSWARFEAIGYTVREIGLTDIAPRLPMVPFDLYARTMNVVLWTEMSIPETMAVITSVSVEIAVEGVEVGHDERANLGQ